MGKLLDAWGENYKAFTGNSHGDGIQFYHSSQYSKDMEDKLGNDINILYYLSKMEVRWLATAYPDLEVDELLSLPVSIAFSLYKDVLSFGPHIQQLRSVFSAISPTADNPTLHWNRQKWMEFFGGSYDQATKLDFTKAFLGADIVRIFSYDTHKKLELNTIYEEITTFYWDVSQNWNLSKKHFPEVIGAATGLALAILNGEEGLLGLEDEKHALALEILATPKVLPDGTILDLSSRKQLS